MSEQENSANMGATRVALKAFRLYSAAMIRLFLINILLRAIACCPLILLLVQINPVAPAVCLAAALVLSILIVLPLRVYSRARYRHWLSNGQWGTFPDYQRCLRFSLKRFSMSYLWGLPCAALIGAWCYGFWMLNFNEFMPILLKISRFFGGTYYDLGTAAWMIAIALSGALFLYGWRRGMTKDFVSLAGFSDRDAMNAANHVRRRHRRRLALHALTQIPCLLPSLIACAAVLCGYVMSSVEWSSSLTNNATRLMALIRTPLPGGTLIPLVLIVLFVHAPLALLRRLRTAAVMNALFADSAPHGEGADHAA